MSQTRALDRRGQHKTMGNVRFGTDCYLLIDFEPSLAFSIYL